MLKTKFFSLKPKKNLPLHYQDQEELFLNNQENWLEPEREGELAVDVYQTPKDIVVKSTIAGAKQEDLNITVNHDIITIRGKRIEEKKIEEKDYLYRECYWGSFSRSIILPAEIKTDKIKASLKNGVLTVILPKAQKAAVIKIKEQ